MAVFRITAVNQTCQLNINKSFNWQFKFDRADRPIHTEPTELFTLNQRSYSHRTDGVTPLDLIFLIINCSPPVPVHMRPGGHEQSRNPERYIGELPLICLIWGGIEETPAESKLW